jgi:hypothetical protein
MEVRFLSPAPSLSATKCGFLMVSVVLAASTRDCESRSAGSNPVVHPKRSEWDTLSATLVLSSEEGGETGEEVDVL